ncbi:hypothetical protein AVEN_154088-1, partial [Araneus ventricosus]
TSKSKFILIY